MCWGVGPEGVFFSLSLPISNLQNAPCQPTQVAQDDGDWEERLLARKAVFGWQGLTSDRPFLAGACTSIGPVPRPRWGTPTHHLDPGGGKRAWRDVGQQREERKKKSARALYSVKAKGREKKGFTCCPPRDGLNTYRVRVSRTATPIHPSQHPHRTCSLSTSPLEQHPVLFSGQTHFVPQGNARANAGRPPHVMINDESPPRVLRTRRD